MRTVHLTPLPAALLALTFVPGRAGAFLLPSDRRSLHAPLFTANEISSWTDITDSDLSSKGRQAFGFNPPTEIDSDNTPPSLQVRALSSFIFIFDLIRC